MYKADPARFAVLEEYLVQMNTRGLAEHFGAQGDNTVFFTPPNDALSTAVMYFQALVLAPSDRRMLARDIIGVPSSQLSPENKACNASLSYWYGPTWILTYLTGITDPAKAHIDFDRVYEDQDYVESLRANIAFARKHGHPIWTTTELHTSIQTAARNYCREKYKDPARKADSLDLVEWIASLKKNGWMKKVLEQKTLEAAYNAYCEPKGVGPYFGGNSIMMVANLKEVEYSHEENFCAPGGGAISTLSWLLEGQKFNPLKAIQWITDEQEKLMPRLTVPKQFQNMLGHDGMILKKDQTRYTANSFEVGLCQCSVYRKFLDDPASMSRRKNLDYDMTPFRLREAILADTKDFIEAQRAVDDALELETSKLRLDLLEF